MPRPNDLIRSLDAKLSAFEVNLEKRVRSAIQASTRQWQEPLSTLTSQLAVIGQRLGELDEKLTTTVGANLELRQYQRMLQENFQRQADQSQALDDARHHLVETKKQLDEANEHIAILHAAIETQPDNNAPNESSDIERQLKEQLDEALTELENFRQQNSELATRIAQKTTTAASSSHAIGSIQPEMLTWEERKKHMLEQLEFSNQTCDVATQATVSNETRVQIEDVIARTDTEISRRDQEIQELREIVQSQAGAHQGVAIGATGLAQMFDSNELIVQERMRLKDIQEEWEAKLRQAEIDLSMERAKLARERVELETQLMEIPQRSNQSRPAGQVGSDRQRRWLDYLGLKEEKNG